MSNRFLKGALTFCKLKPAKLAAASCQQQEKLSQHTTSNKLPLSPICIDKMASITQPLPKPVVKSTTMDSKLSQKAIKCSLNAIEDGYADKDVAASVRQQFQELYPTSVWHCFVGRDMVSFVVRRSESPSTRKGSTPVWHIFLILSAFF